MWCVCVCVCVYTRCGIHTHTHTQYVILFIYKKNEILFAATWMDLENIILSEKSQTEKDKYCVILLICGILKMIQMNLFTKQKWTHRHRKQTWLPEGKAGAGGGVAGREKSGIWD